MLIRSKCDENGPPCYGCVTRALTCEYSNRARLAQRSKAVVVSSALNALKPHSDLPPAEASSKVKDTSSIKKCVGQSSLDHHKIELALMNHWTASTYLTFCHQTLQKVQEEERRFWQQDVPKLALEYSYLLHAMFSVTNLHLASQMKDSISRDKHITAGVEHHSSSLRLFMQAVSDTIKHDCEAIYICSLAFFVLSIALPQMIPIQQEGQVSIRDSIFECLELYKGSRRILNMYEEELRNKSSATVLASKDMNAYPLEDVEFSQAVARLRQCKHLRMSAMQGTAITCDSDPVTSAIDELESCSKRLANGINAALVGWLIGLDDDFLQALREHDTFATIIVMHWAVLLDKPNRLWWSFRSGQSLVRELSSEMPSLHILESEACEWCYSQVGISSYS